jgi:ethanolamine permease
LVVSILYLKRWHDKLNHFGILCTSGAYEMSTNTPYYASKYQLLALCLMSSLGSIYSTWNRGLKHGLGYELVANAVLGPAFVIYNCCASELSSTFPFPGGSYGLARCTLGFFPGYLVGCCEIFYYILNYAFSNGSVIYTINVRYPDTYNYAVPMLLLLMIVETAICISSRRILWTAIALFASYTVIVNFSFIFGSIPRADFDRYAYSTEPAAAASAEDKTLFKGNASELFMVLPLIFWSYIGPEFVNLTCDDVEQPRKEIPFAQVTGMVIVLLHNTAIFVVASSMYPGVDNISSLLFPLNPGFHKLFRISDAGAEFLTLVPDIGFSLCACFAYSKLIVSMSDSKLFPSILSRRLQRSNMPIYAALVGQLLSILFTVVVYLFTSLIDFWPVLVVAFAFITYCIQLLGYISMQIKLTSFEREFRSPFGVYGAIYAFVVFFTGFVACCVAYWYTIPVVLVYLGIVSAYYQLWARDRQTFSAEEKMVMLPAHVEIRDANGKMQSRDKLSATKLCVLMIVCCRVSVWKVCLAGMRNALVLSSTPLTAGCY